MAQSKAPVKVLLDVLSQPSRALLIFCRASGLPHEFINTSIAKKAHQSPEFTKMQPLQTVGNLLALLVEVDLNWRSTHGRQLLSRGGKNASKMVTLPKMALG